MDRILIRLDNDIIEWFRYQVDEMGRGNYQTLINAVLHDHILSVDGPLEEILRKVNREELSQYRPE